jgi:Aldo/keto reductase family
MARVSKTERCPARSGLHDHQVQSRTETRSQRLSAASSSSGSSASTRTSSTGRRSDRPGRGREWSELRSLVTHARSGFQTSRSPNSSRYGEHRAGRQPGAVQSVRVPEGRLGTCRADGIILEAYSPLGRGRHLGSETATRIAQRLGRTPAQVLLRWCIERGVPLVAKSTHRDRIAENAEIFDFTLSDEDMAELDALDRTGGTQRALERKWW